MHAHIIRSMKMPLPSNANLFKTFKGKIAYTDANNNTKYAMLSCTNEVIFMDRLTSDANKFLGQLPNELTPRGNILFPIRYVTGLDYIRINSDGRMLGGLANTTYLTDGFSYNISSKFYA